MTKLRDLFEKVMSEHHNLGSVSTNRNKLYSELSEILNYAGIQCNRLNIREVRSGGVYIHVVIERREKLQAEVVGDAAVMVQKAEGIRTHVLPMLLLDLDAPLPMAEYWCLQQNLKAAQRETKERAEHLKRAQFREFEAEVAANNFKSNAADADVFTLQQLEAL